MSKYIFLSGVMSDIFGSLFGFIGDSIVNFFFSIIVSINAMLYSLVSYLYQIFTVLAQGGKIFDDSIVKSVVNRLYIIIGVIILFLVAYSLLKTMINPDEAIKGKKSPIKIIKDVLISIVLIAFVPTIFEFAFQFQESLLVNNTIGKLIVGGTSNNTATTIMKGGFEFASTIWKSFLIVDSDYCDAEDEVIVDGVSERDNLKRECKLLITDQNAWEKLWNTGGVTYGELWDKAQKEDSFFPIIPAVDFIIKGNITYMFIIDIVVGVFVVFVLVSYCLEMALRLVKLAFYEIIAPLPIFARIIPNDNANKIFNNWVKAVLSTFAEAFIRIALLFIAILIINTVGKSIDNIFASSYASGARPFVVLFAKVLTIVGILMFIKQAPNIIKEITGLDGGKYNVLKSAKQGFSLIAGGIAGGGNPLAAWRSYNDAGSAKIGDFSTIGNQYKRRMAGREASDLQKAAGMNFFERKAANAGNSIRQTFGLGTKKEATDAKLEKYQDQKGNYMNVTNDTGSQVSVFDEKGNAMTIQIRNKDNKMEDLKNNVTFELTPENLNILNEAKANNNAAKAEISQQVNTFKGVMEGNKIFTDTKGKAEDIAKGEMKKGKFYLREDNGNYLTLSYTDTVTGTIESIGATGATQTELESWLAAAKDHMSVDDYKKLSTKLNQSLNDWSVKSFYDTNGEFNGSTNSDIKLAKRETAQNYLERHIYNVDQDGQIIQDTTYDYIFDKFKKTDGSIDWAAVESNLNWDLINSIKGTAKDINDGLSLRSNEATIKQSNIDSQNTKIDSIINKGKDQVEVIKNSPEYHAQVATEKAQNINNNAKKS